MTGSSHRCHSRVVRRRLRLAIAVGAALLAVYPAVSYAQALAAPGQAGVDVRTVGWLRSMGAGGAVNAVENWWYIHNVPPAGPPSPSAVPRPAGAPAHSMVPLPVARDARALPGEGRWSSLSGGVLATTFVQPDPVHRSVIAGVARFSLQNAALTLHPGTQDPRGATRWGAPRVTADERSRLLATFNSGFLMIDSHGGWYANGHLARPLRAGAASLVIRRDGTATVGRWGMDVGMSPDVAAVRQNLDLIVIGGQPVRGLDGNAYGQFGNADSQHQYTWRSGIGVDAAGRLVYAAGNQLTLATLASALQQAGAVRGMELDMHSSMVSFNVFVPGNAQPPTTLLPNMPSPATRYLTADQRDFLTLTSRTPVRHQPLRS